MLHVLAGVPASGEGEVRKTRGEADVECGAAVPFCVGSSEVPRVGHQSWTRRFRHRGHQEQVVREQGGSMRREKVQAEKERDSASKSIYARLAGTHEARQPIRVPLEGDVRKTKSSFSAFPYANDTG